MTRRAPQAQAAPWTSAQIVAYLRREARDWDAVAQYPAMTVDERLHYGFARDALRDAARVIAAHTRTARTS